MIQALKQNADIVPVLTCITVIHVMRVITGVLGTGYLCNSEYRPVPYSLIQVNTGK